MSTLLTVKLSSGSSFNQTIRISRPTYVAFLRPWVFINGTLSSGEFTLKVKDNGVVLGTYTIDYSEINAAVSEQYAHGYIRFDLGGLQLNVPEDSLYKEYELEFSMENYIESSSFLSLCRTWDKKIGVTYGDVDGNNQGINDTIEPIGIEIYTYESI